MHVARDRGHHETQGLRQNHGHVGRGGRGERSDCRSARADAARQGARVEVQGHVGRGARRRKAAGMHVCGHPLHAQYQPGRQRQRREPRFRGIWWRRWRWTRRRPGWRARRWWRLRGRWRRGWNGGGGVRRSRDSQRRLGVRQQPDRDRRRDPADHEDGDGGGQGERDRQAHGRQAGSGARVPGGTGRRRSRRILRRSPKRNARPSSRPSSTP